MIVGIAGLGKMGSAFAQRLLEHGYRVSVWDRSPQRAAVLTSAGATPYDSLTKMAASVDVVIVSLWGDDVAREVTLNQIIPAMHPPQVLIEMSTLSPGMYVTLEGAAQEHDVDFVAAPVLGNPDAVRAGALSVLAGGAPESVQRVRDVLAALGNVTEMNSVRASGFLKLANNTVLGVLAETLGELLAFCDRAGIDRDLAVRSLTGSMQRVAQQKLQPLLERNSEPRFTLAALLKDLHLAHQAAESAQVPVPVLDAVVPNAELAVEDGLGDRDYIVLALERPKQQATAT
jgi:3-hydroxyisobutyrate dehydrogenase-like beta-hydroxyacid dehydrogenase